MSYPKLLKFAIKNGRTNYEPFLSKKKKSKNLSSHVKIHEQFWLVGRNIMTTSVILLVMSTGLG